MSRPNEGNRKDACCLAGREANCTKDKESGLCSPAGCPSLIE